MRDFSKKIIIPLLILGVLALAAPFVQETRAQIPRDTATTFELPPENFSLLTPPTQTNQTGQQDPLKNLEEKLAGVGCGIIVGYSMFSGECITKGLAWLSFVWLKIVGVLLNIAGFLFNAALGVTIDNNNYTASRVPALNFGWAFSRDVVNLFFIFILLFIAVATILQIESYGAKALLARLIIIALLVNFSLLAAQFIIFVTNALTVTIYNAQQDVPDATSGTFFNLRFRKDFSAVITSGFHPQRLLGELPLNEFEKGNVISIMLAIIEVAVLGSVVIFTAAFILLAGAFFLITRMVLLWFLVILAPFGFVLLILPTTRGYAQTWWKTLQSQAIFAPVFMFLLVITGIIIRNSFPIIFARVGQASGIPEFLFLIFMQSALTIILLLASLLLAKQMGIMGANTATGLAQNAGKWFRGYAGRTAWRQFGGAATTSALAATGPALARQLSRIPLIGRALGGLTRGVSAPITRGAAYSQAQARKTYDDQAKAFTNLQPNQLARVLATANPNLQRAILDKTKDKKRSDTLKAMGENAAVRLGKNMKPFGMDKDVAKAVNNPATAMKILHPGLKAPARDLKNIPPSQWNEDEKKYQNAMNDFGDTLNDKEIGQLDPEAIGNNVNVQNMIFQTFNPRRFNALMKNREQLDAVVSLIKKLMVSYKGDKKDMAAKFAHLKDMVQRDFETDLDNLIKPDKNATPPMAVNLLLGAQDGGRARAGGQAVLTIPAGEAGEGETEGTT